MAQGPPEIKLTKPLKTKDPNPIMFLSLSEVRHRKRMTHASPQSKHIKTIRLYYNPFPMKKSSEERKRNTYSKTLRHQLR